MPDVLRIGILPDEGKDTLIQRYTPLFKYLSSELSVSYKLIIPANYQELLDLFSNGSIDLAYFGGFTFIKANYQFDAVPLVMRDVDTRFTSYFIARPSKKLTKLTDFKNMRFSFGSRLSTSGHLMPRYFLQQEQLNPEHYFSTVTYSNKHDNTVYWIRDGKADLGAVNSKIFDKLVKDKLVNSKEVHIIWETPPYPDYVWALRSGFSSSIHIRIQNAFLSLSPASSEHIRILNGLDAKGFLPAAVSDFKQLQDISHKLGLISTNNDK